MGEANHIFPVYFISIRLKTDPSAILLVLIQLICIQKELFLSFNSNPCQNNEKVKQKNGDFDPFPIR